MWAWACCSYQLAQLLVRCARLLTECECQEPAHVRGLIFSLRLCQSDEDLCQVVQCCGRQGQNAHRMTSENDADPLKQEKARKGAARRPFICGILWRLSLLSVRWICAVSEGPSIMSPSMMSPTFSNFKQLQLRFTDDHHGHSQTFAALLSALWRWRACSTWNKLFPAADALYLRSVFKQAMAASDYACGDALTKATDV